jgi:acyl-coenzyme A thioesterase PaaI-like protein
MAARAAVAASHHPHPVAASAHFLRPPAPGPAVIETELVRAGRAVDQLHVRLAQEGTPCVEAVVSTATLTRSAEVAWDGGMPPRPAAAFDDCLRTPATMPNGTRVAILEQVDLRLDPASVRSMRGAPSGRGELRGWLRLGHGEPFDAASLLYAVDAFPPAAFDVAFSGWVPTLELTAYVRALPVPGPVQVVQQARMIADGRVDEACFVWDAGGRLVAQATQLAGIRPG